MQYSSASSSHLGKRAARSAARSRVYGDANLRNQIASYYVQNDEHVEKMNKILRDYTQYEQKNPDGTFALRHEDTAYSLKPYRGVELDVLYSPIQRAVWRHMHCASCDNFLGKMTMGHPTSRRMEVEEVSALVTTEVVLAIAKMNRALVTENSEGVVKPLRLSKLKSNWLSELFTGDPLGEKHARDGFVNKLVSLDTNCVEFYNMLEALYDLTDGADQDPVALSPAVKYRQTHQDGLIYMMRGERGGSSVQARESKWPENPNQYGYKRMLNRQRALYNENGIPRILFDEEVQNGVRREVDSEDSHLAFRSTIHGRYLQPCQACVSMKNNSSATSYFPVIPSSEVSTIGDARLRPEQLRDSVDHVNLAYGNVNQRVERTFIS